jgi:imidazolonepropionase-like amidohydrolase
MVPGLINLHTHLIGNADGLFFENLKQESDNITILRAARNAERALKSGITTLRDCGGRNRVIFDLKKSIEMGIIQGPRLIISGKPITKVRGHLWPIGIECKGDGEVREAVKNVLKDGADFIKILATGGGTPGTDPYSPAFSVNELKAAV